MFSFPQMAGRVRRRMTVQLVSLLALNSSWGPEAKWFCSPVLNCHSCALAWFACPIGVFIHFSGYRLFPFFALGTVLLIAVLLGRWLCGWVCPFGFLQDLLHRIPTRKISLPRWTNAIKYGVLILTVFLLPFLLGELTQFSFCRICPASAVQVTIPGLAKSGFAGIAGSTAVRLGVLAVVIVFSVLSTRAFCRVLCPIGALLAPLNLISFGRVRAPKGKCVSCSRCDKVCPTDDRPSERLMRGQDPSRSADCVLCGDCSAVCPTSGRENPSNSCVSPQ